MSASPAHDDLPDDGSASEDLGLPPNKMLPFCPRCRARGTMTAEPAPLTLPDLELTGTGGPMCSDDPRPGPVTTPAGDTYIPSDGPWMLPRAVHTVSCFLCGWSTRMVSSRPLD